MFHLLGQMNIKLGETSLTVSHKSDEVTKDPCIAENKDPPNTATPNI
jgi:hypothetical protein